MFESRSEAGHRLAEKLTSYKKKQGVIVVGLARGGVETAKAVSSELKLPLAPLVVRKIGAPNQEELAIGALAPGGIKILDKRLIRRLGVDQKYLKEEVKRQEKVLKKRTKKYGDKKISYRGKRVILVDDGVATGTTVEAAVKYFEKKGTKELILAVPVVPADTLARLNSFVDEVVVIETPDEFRSVGEFYRNFPQVTDEEVVKLLQ